MEDMQLLMMTRRIAGVAVEPESGKANARAVASSTAAVDLLLPVAMTPPMAAYPSAAAATLA
jgi:hypothetical protein